tara:strand:- start:496 stop:1413 length:918 start_codon:yes stop_codon:yes gene_type:complete
MEKDERIPLILTPASPRSRWNRRIGVAAACLTSLQFSAFALFRTHLARGACDATILAGSELLKLLSALVGCALTGEWPVHINSWFEVLPLTLCFIAMNIIAMYCTTLVSASLFVVLMQLKLVFTTLLSLACLNRRFGLTKLLSLALIVVGCVTSSHTSSDTKGGVLIGICGLVLETFMSGASSVYAQALLSKANIWCRNVQLAAVSMLTYVIVIIPIDARCVRAPPRAMNWEDIILVLLSAMGGICVAFTLKYAGAVEKTVATSASIVLTTTFESLLSSSYPPFERGCGATIVLLATLLYATAHE